jgi:cell cycle sensor histidine kinase DivJ
MRCRPVIDQLGDVRAVVAVTRDISALRERENELLDARESADRANRAKTQFLAHMSHELRTPLNAIIGFSDILQGDAAGELSHDRRLEYAGLIHSSGEHLLQVVNSILDMSKIESGMFAITPDRLELAPLIANSCDMMSQQAASRGISLVRAIPDDLPEILADLRACRQILLNLLSNAIKFTERGGTVTVGARVEGKVMAIFVRDTGIGIAARDLPHLGTPFVQAETVYSRNYEGTGLGLSMVKGLAALHGGRLVIESKPGVGTTATALLPIEQAVKRLPVAIAEGEALPTHQEEERKSA